MNLAAGNVVLKNILDVESALNLSICICVFDGTMIIYWYRTHPPNQLICVTFIQDKFSSSLYVELI